MADEDYCGKHGAHCIQIERLERDICTQKNEIKDTRKSLTHDMERRDTALLKIAEETKRNNERLYVTKTEFEPIRKLVYGLAALMLAYAAKMVML